MGNFATRTGGTLEKNYRIRIIPRRSDGAAVVIMEWSRDFSVNDAKSLYLDCQEIKRRHGRYYIVDILTKENFIKDVTILKGLYSEGLEGVLKDCESFHAITSTLVMTTFATMILVHMTDLNKYYAKFNQNHVARDMKTTLKTVGMDTAEIDAALRSLERDAQAPSRITYDPSAPLPFD